MNGGWWVVNGESAAAVCALLMHMRTIPSKLLLILTMEALTAIWIIFSDAMPHTSGTRIAAGLLRIRDRLRVEAKASITIVHIGLPRQRAV